MTEQRPLNAAFPSVSSPDVESRHADFHDTTHLALLYETLMTVSDLSVACASLVTAGQTASLPLLWFQTAAQESLAAALESDPTVAAAEGLVHTDDRHRRG